MNRCEKYLKLLLENPNQWVQVRKLDRPWSKRYNNDERIQLMKQIEGALNLMGISFEKHTTFKIRVVTPRILVKDTIPTGVAELMHLYKMGMDYSSGLLDSKTVMSILYDEEMVGHGILRSQHRQGTKDLKHHRKIDEEPR